MLLRRTNSNLSSLYATVNTPLIGVQPHRQPSLILHTKNLEHMTRRETFYKCSQGVPQWNMSILCQNGSVLWVFCPPTRCILRQQQNSSVLAKVRKLAIRMLTFCMCSVRVLAYSKKVYFTRQVACCIVLFIYCDYCTYLYDQGQDQGQGQGQSQGQGQCSLGLALWLVLTLALVLHDKAPL